MRYRNEDVRALTIVNLLLWCLLFLGSIPYTQIAGWSDPIGIQVRWILAVTAALQLALFGLRRRGRRPVLG